MHGEDGEFYVSQTADTPGRPPLRVLYQIEEALRRVTIHHIGLA
jgi:hypothetical protein